MWNAGLDESQAGIKVAGRNINNLRLADDTTLMAEKWRGTKETLDEDEREEWKRWLETQHWQSLYHDIWFYHFMANRRVEAVTDFIFLGSKITEDDCSHEIKGHLLLESFPKPRQCIKKERHPLGQTHAYSQSYGFSSSHV